MILDEVHERLLESDLALALCRDLQRALRPELRLIAMSATVDGARLAGTLDADVIESAGRMSLVEVRHAARDNSAARAICPTRRPAQCVPRWRSTRATSSPSCPAWRRSAARRRRWRTVVHLVRRHGELLLAEQDRALRPAERRRVVLGDLDRRDLDCAWRADRGVDGGHAGRRGSTPAGSTRLTTLRTSRGGGTTGWPRGRVRHQAPPSGCGHRAAPRPGGPRPAGDPRGGVVGTGTRLRRLGAAPGDLPFPATRRRKSALAAATALLTELARSTPQGASPTPAAVWRRSARIRG